MTDANARLITKSELRAGLQILGIQAGALVMVHSSYKAIGPVMGGPNIVVQALLETLGAEGTLMMYVGWEDIPDFIADLPADQQQLYLAEHPPFDPAIARAVRAHGIIAECLRTWPGAIRSENPEASVVAIGARARELVQDHPRDYGYGAGSPLAKLVAWQGQVLMLGAPLDTITLLHHAEFLARLCHKATVHFRCQVLKDGQTIWIDVEDYNTGQEHDAYTFEEIARAYLASSGGRQGQVGHATSYLFDAANLTEFAVAWLEERFGTNA
jgi:aminoglycoside 3-N-acetyltransferase